MSTGKINVTVLGGMLDGNVYTVPLDTRALSLTHTGDSRDAVTFVCARAADGHAYALHPVTGMAKFDAINEAVNTVLTAMAGPPEARETES